MRRDDDDDDDDDGDNGQDDDDDGGADDDDACQTTCCRPADQSQPNTHLQLAESFRGLQVPLAEQHRLVVVPLVFPPVKEVLEPCRRRT